jgi:hypothetical protein
MTAEINNNRWLSSCWMRPGPGLLASELSESGGLSTDQLNLYQPGQADCAHHITTWIFRPSYGPAAGKISLRVTMNMR